MKINNTRTILEMTGNNTKMTHNTLTSDKKLYSNDT